MGKPEMPAFKPHKYTGSTRISDAKGWEVKGVESEALKGGPPVHLGGETGRWSPEDMFLGALNSCQLGSFLYMARQMQLNVLGYDSEIEGILDVEGETFTFQKVTIRPVIRVGSEEEIEKALECSVRAHGMCFIGNSVKAEIIIEPKITAG